MNFKPRPYQQIAIDHIRDNRNANLFLGLGCGKTIITLTLLEELINSFEVSRPLIIAPKRVAENTWGDEMELWSHTKNLRLSIIAGTPAQRKAAALRKDADIFIIGRDNVKWLVDWMLDENKLLFDMLVLDELTSFKNHQSKRFKALRKIAPKMQRVIGLTGTPCPNGIGDLWSQIYLLDQGERLCKTVTDFRANYMSRKYNGFGWEARPGAEDVVMGKIKDICLSMRSEDYLDVPERIDVVDHVQLTSMAKYDKFVKESILSMQESGEDIVALNKGALYMKLLQYCNGAVKRNAEEIAMSGGPAWIEVGTEKLDALEEEIELLEGQPVLVLYQFKADLERIKARMPKARQLLSSQDLKDWNAGKIKVALAQPQSISMGLNLQLGGHHMIHYGLGWNLETYEQVVGRLHRSGQMHSVVNKHLIARGTLEETVLSALRGKSNLQDAFMKGLRKYL